MNFFRNRIVFFLALVLLLRTLEGKEECENWIVVTTIQYPTKEVKKLASLPGWRLVVVGDKKTPKDWYLENCEYLSPERQLELGYEITAHLPWNHYCRKNIGYLYAIQNGAKVIYETDDDNELINAIDFTFYYEDIVQLESDGSKVANVYAYFGHPTVWPRGYPLNQVIPKSLLKYKKLTKPLQIGVIQSLINKDSDVDAIFRLTQYRDVYFNQEPPCLLPSGVFCPFNTQNTVFNYNAFWGLYVPCTTAFRVCDIWRGYIVQRLLWDVNLSLCFGPPTAVQERNQHDLFKDFLDEQDLYAHSGRLIDFLSTWKDSSPTLEKRFFNLTQELIQNKFLKPLEATVLSAWINDLQKLSYQFPQLGE